MTANNKSAPRRWVRAILANGALGIFSILFALGAAELAIRIAAPQQLILIRPDLWQAVDTVGWDHRPNVDIQINTGERDVRVLTDAQGLRVGAEGRVSNGFPVLVLGDSFMEALQVEYEQSFAGLLQKDLPPTAGAPVAVRNAGIGGWDPNQYLLRAESLLRSEPYKLVVAAIYVGNDVVEKRREYFPPRQREERSEFRFPRALAKNEFVDAWLRPFNDALEVRSHLFILARNRLKTLRMKAGLHPLGFSQEYLKQTANSERWALTADICKDIAELAAAHGAPTLFVLIPDALQVSPKALDAYLTGYNINPADVDLEQPNRLLREELERRGMPVIDVLPAFRAAREKGVQLHGNVDAHLTPEGHKILADLVTPTAAQMLQQTLRPAPSVIREVSR